MKHCQTAEWTEKRSTVRPAEHPPTEKNGKSLANMPSIKTHVKEGPQTPSGSLINGLPIMEILKVPAASSITCNDTLLGALLASASDAQKVCPNQSTREHALPAPLVAHRSPLLWPRQQDAALLHKAFLRNEPRQSGGGPHIHMPMLTH
jgi:hypothetical protein